MSAVLAAILGASVAFLIGWIARAVGVPTDVRRHDSAIRERDGSLETWIADRHYQLCQDCRRVRETGHGKSLADREIADLKARALHEFRDEARLARGDAARILTSENWTHGLWRRVRKQPSPIIAAEDRAEPLLNAWRRATRE